MPDLAAQIAARIQERLGDPLDAVLTAWADAIQEEAPRNTGALAMSVHTERTSPTAGAVVMKFYGQMGAENLPMLSQAPRNVRARARYAQQVGRTIAHPNPFYQRAWESERVQQALSQFGELVFQRG